MSTTIESTQDELRKHIGRCFKQPSDNTWCIIYDVPQPEYGMMHTDFNENQMPAMFLHFLPEVKDGLPFLLEIFQRISATSLTNNFG